MQRVITAAETAALIRKVQDLEDEVLVATEKQQEVHKLLRRLKQALLRVEKYGRNG